MFDQIILQFPRGRTHHRLPLRQSHVQRGNRHLEVVVVEEHGVHVEENGLRNVHSMTRGDQSGVERTLQRLHVNTKSGGYPKVDGVEGGERVLFAERRDEIRNLDCRLCEREGKKSADGERECVLLEVVVEQLLVTESTRVYHDNRGILLLPSKFDISCAPLRIPLYTQPHASPLTITSLLVTLLQNELRRLLPALLLLQQRVAQASALFPPTRVRHAKARLDEVTLQGSFVAEERAMGDPRLEGSENHVVVAVMEAEVQKLLAFSDS